MQSPQTPGVYYERVDASAPAIALLRTDIAAFVGIATRGPLHQPLPVQSWRQFQAYFGDFTGAGYLAYAARGFFENGGQRCWIVRVASEAASGAAATLQSGSLADVWIISASSPGVWGNDLDIAIRETHRAQTLTVPEKSTPEFSAVLSTAGFGRAAQVRLSQGAVKIHKVVSDIDAVNQRLLWINPKRDAQLPYDGALSGFDPERPILIESIEYTLWVRELGRLIRVYESLSLVPENPRYGPALLGEFELPRFSGQPVNLPAAPEPVTIRELRGLPLGALDSIATTADQIIPLTGGADGLAQLSAYDFIGAEIDPLDSDEVRDHKARGLRTLEDVREVAIVTVPDIHIQPKPSSRFSPPPPCIPDPCLPAGVPPAVPRPPSAGDLPPLFPESAIYQVQSALIEHCEKLRDRIALLDPPFSAARDDKLGVGAARSWRSRFDSKYAAFYYPWLRVIDPLRSPGSLVREIPPSGHVAGQYAQNDLQFGVHKAPANVPLISAEDVTLTVDDAVHGILNPAGVNVIRPLPGRGLRVFGARTMSSDSDWRYVNVRRLMMMIEKAVEAAIQWAVFEPDSPLTRTKLNLTLTNFLLSLWQRGALMGASASDAFFVECNDDNNPPEEREQGRLIARIGVAPSRPFEFIILRVGRAHNQFEISEAPGGASGLEVF